MVAIVGNCRVCEDVLAVGDGTEHPERDFIKVYAGGFEHTTAAGCVIGARRQAARALLAELYPNDECDGDHLRPKLPVQWCGYCVLVEAFRRVGVDI